MIWLDRIPMGAVIVIDPEKSSYKNLDAIKSTSPLGAWGFYEDNKQNIWVSTIEGLQIINATRDKITYLKKANGLANDTLRGITGDKNGRVCYTCTEGNLDRHGKEYNQELRRGSGV
jgi:ligand-binding sensor domain-containing protein